MMIMLSLLWRWVGACRWRLFWHMLMIYELISCEVMLQAWVILSRIISCIINVCISLLLLKKKRCMYITISLYYIRCLTIFRKKKKRKKKSWSILCGVVLTNYSIHILKHKIPFRFLELIIVIVSFQFD